MKQYHKFLSLQSSVWSLKKGSEKFFRETAFSAFLLAVGAASALAQGVGSVNSADPSAPGYVYRASRMLSSGNPLGAKNQTAASADDFEYLSSEMQAEWLAAEGCALFERGDAACVDVLTRLVTDYPASGKATQALLTLGDWYWYHADWHEAIDRYAKVDIRRLGAGQRSLYSYRKGLAYLKCGLPESAEPLFASVAKDPEYARASKYYIAYIHYLHKDYDTAYRMMEEVAQESSVLSRESSEADPGKSSVLSPESSEAEKRRGRGRRSMSPAASTPASSPNLARPQRQYVSDGIEPLYYMVQIEYLRGDYDDVIDHASTIMAKNPVEELLPELHRVTGLSYFKNGDNANARPHLEDFVAAVETPNDDAVYALGAIQYADDDLTEAEKNLRTLTDRNNDLAQGAYLYLGQIAERKGDMNAAAMAFAKAANMAFDQNVAETASYNHIVALTKGGNAPFASNISMLESFLEKYPDSHYASDVQESLAAAYFYEHDYHKALNSINKVRNPSKATLASKQKILYKLGTSEITSGSLTSASNHLREAADMRDTDSKLADEARLWLGEALYGGSDYKAAAAAYNAALRGELTPDNRATARYGLAYSHFKMHDWNEAQKNFANVAESSSAPASMKGDALVREGDCLLYLGDYQKSASKFLRASREGAGDADYAAFRYAVVAGVTEGTDSKMKKLNAFLKEKPNSKWTSDVLLEAGKTMAALDMPDKAAPYFERLSREYPKDNKSRAGALSLALSYMKQGETDKAKSAYMEIIRSWPTSEEASIANDDMRRISAADGSLIEYSRFLAGIEGAPKIDPDEMDAITFEAAETAYAADQSNTARLERYINDFPDGRYLANALMDLAEAADNEGDPSKTLIYLERLLSKRGDSPQVPAALFLKAALLENAGDRKKALDTYL
ncbi:MAG: tetratricopeptide repeat protein, partial [Muribaculaceae bacterium]|nr:tetratricopeptide repeat protein [Muribaculaceae bacterium]